jgi:hypothetical protein
MHVRLILILHRRFEDEYSSCSTAMATDDEGSSRDRERRAEKEGGTEVQSSGKEQEESHPWQAGESLHMKCLHSGFSPSISSLVWDATRQAWYFWNSATQETTWENPLEKSKKIESNGKDDTERDTTATAPTMLTDEEVAESFGIDPDLAYLDPALYASEVRQARKGNSTYAASGAFDSRTGKFVPLSATGAKGAHDPSRLSHANQADRQMSAFFDIQQYEQERKRSREEREQEEAEGISKKRAPTKKELQRYKERAREKKAAKYAWLRE